MTAIGDRLPVVVPKPDDRTGAKLPLVGDEHRSRPGPKLPDERELASDRS